MSSFAAPPDLRSSPAVWPKTGAPTRATATQHACRLDIDSAALAHPAQKAFQDAQAHRVGVAHALHPQYHDANAVAGALDNRRQMRFEIGRRAEEQLPFQAVDEDAPTRRITGDALADDPIRRQ